MKLQVASDFHLEMFSEKKKDYMDYVNPSADYLALVGDIGAPGKKIQCERVRSLLKKLSPHFKHIFLLAGNHEYYVPGKEPNMPTITDIDALLEDLCSSFENVTFLQKKTVLVEGVRVVGATLWSEIASDKFASVERVMGDFKMIYVEDEQNVGKTRLFKAADSVKLFKDHLEYIIGEVALARDRGEKVVVLTHHAPVLEGSSHPKHKNSPLNSAFASNLKSIIKKKDFSHVKVWAYGHTHFNNERRVGKTVVLSNQTGYSFEQETVKSYKASHCIEIE